MTQGEPDQPRSLHPPQKPTQLPERLAVTTLPTRLDNEPRVAAGAGTAPELSVEAGT